MIQTEKEDTVDKNRQDISIDKEQVQQEHSVKDLQALISRMETENAKP